ncbi:MAG: c-type cytochrome biogenesis protein CcmI [Pseudomonadota bacterium]
MFWLITVLTAALVALTLGLALFRRGLNEGAQASDIAVYRDQLREVERDHAKGVLTKVEADQVRLEVSRRLLDADKAAAETTERGAPRWASFAMGSLLILVLIGGAVGLYSWIGAPGYPDLPLERRIALAEQARISRPDQATAEAGISNPSVETGGEFADLIARLRGAVAERPDDLQGHVLLAQNEARLGNFSAAHVAQSRVIEIIGDSATADDFAALADLLILAAGGYVSPEAETALGAALERDPANGTARYYTGLLARQTGRPDVAFRMWRALLESSPPDAPWSPPIRAQIRDVAQLAGVDYIVPDAGQLRGPSQDDINAAGDMSPAERLAMIEGMVGGLAERLATEGGPPSDWARLIRAYGVLGRREAAAAIWAEAQAVFPDDITRVPILQAARDAGVAQ